MTALPRGEERGMAIELFVFPPSSRAFNVLRVANQRGPHWADPLKSWGAVLAKQGHGKEARANYDEALKYVPNWAALKTACDALTKPKS
jgi:Flp pilus assembly protein TadD